MQMSHDPLQNISNGSNEKNKELDKKGMPADYCMFIQVCRKLLHALTLLEIWISIMKKCTCFSPLFSASFSVTIATSMAVQATP